MNPNRTSPAHTPGPWHVELTRIPQFLIELDDGSTIATVGEGLHEGGSLEELQANACLIAAAPELLAVAREAADFLGEEFNKLPGSFAGVDDDDVEAYRTILKLLDDAIAKAEGRN